MASPPSSYNTAMDMLGSSIMLLSIDEDSIHDGIGYKSGIHQLSGLRRHAIGNQSFKTGLSELANMSPTDRASHQYLRHGSWCEPLVGTP